MEWSVNVPRKLLVPLIAIFLSTEAISQWIPLPAPSSEDLTDVFFSDSSTGWITGWGGIYRTSDGGDTWELQDSTLTRFIHCPTSTNCWATVWRGDTLLHTTDAGLHWTKYSLGRYPDSLHLPLGKPYFIDSLHGWIVLPQFGLLNEVIKTTDGGNTWFVVGVLDSMQGFGFPSICVFIDTNTGWVSGGSAPVLKTTDGGINWIPLASFGYLEKGIIDLQFVDNQSGWLTAPWHGENVEVRRSSDGGFSWSDQLFIASSTYHTYIRFVDSVRGWLVDANVFGLHIMQTTNAGMDWRIQVTFPIQSIDYPNRIFMVDEHFGGIVGSRGMIYSTKNGGVSAISIEQYPSTTSSSSVYNYPNPFNSSTTFILQGFEVDWIQVQVYDAIGRVVRNLYEGRYSYPMTSLQWDGTNDHGAAVPSGIYLCLIRGIRNADFSVERDIFKFAVLR